MPGDKKKNHKSTANPTQSFLRLKEVKEDVLVMDDNSLRGIVAVSSTNFDLKSQSEQEALIFGYQRFLNSLEFPVQILMQSRRMDIGSYTEKLKNLMEKQTNELLRMQTSEYIEFINRLVESGNIMNKNFYCVISYSGSPVSSGGFFSRLFKRGQAKQIAEKQKGFEKNRSFLDERVITVSSNLSAMGLRVVRLDTNQLIELVYNSYNFEAAPLIDASQLQNITITAGVEPQATVAGAPGQAS